MVDVREARADDAAAVARVHVDSWKTAYRGLLPEEALSRLSYEERTSKWAAILGSPKPGEFTLVAVEGQEIVGFASGGPERQRLPDYQGELYALYVLRRGRGLATEAARAVMRYGFDTFGFGRLICVPRAANRRSIRVAEKLGMAFERSFVHNGKEVVCYAKDNPSTQGPGEWVRH